MWRPRQATPRWGRCRKETSAAPIPAPPAPSVRATALSEKLQEIAGRIRSHAELTRAGNVADPEIARFFQTTHERINAISTDLLFFTLELNRIEDSALDAKLTDPALAHYRPWLRDVRAMRPYQLSGELEKLLHEQSVAGP